MKIRKKKHKTYTYRRPRHLTVDYLNPDFDNMGSSGLRVNRIYGLKWPADLLEIMDRIKATPKKSEYESLDAVLRRNGIAIIGSYRDGNSSGYSIYGVIVAGTHIHPYRGPTKEVSLPDTRLYLVTLCHKNKGKTHKRGMTQSYSLISILNDFIDRENPQEVWRRILSRKS